MHTRTQTSARSRRENAHTIESTQRERERYPSTPTHGGECESSNHRESNAQAHKAVREPEDFITCKQSCVRGEREREREREARAGGAALRDSAGHGQSREISETRELFESSTPGGNVIDSHVTLSAAHKTTHASPRTHDKIQHIPLSSAAPRRIHPSTPRKAAGRNVQSTLTTTPHLSKPTQNVPIRPLSKCRFCTSISLSIL